MHPILNRRTKSNDVVIINWSSLLVCPRLSSSVLFCPSEWYGEQCSTTTTSSSSADVQCSTTTSSSPADLSVVMPRDRCVGQVYHVGLCINYDITRGAGGWHVGRENRTTTKLKELPISFNATRSNSRHKCGASSMSGALTLATDGRSRDGNAAAVEAWGDLPSTEMSAPALEESITNTMASNDRPQPVLEKISCQLQTAC